MHLKLCKKCYTIAVLGCIFLMTLSLLGCVKIAEGKKEKVYDVEPLMGLSWFQSMEQVKTEVSSLEFVEERETDGGYLLDYNGATLYGIEVTVTFCFNDKGLIGVNYHDTKMGHNYIGWQRVVEDHYGSATENDMVSASWFDNPVGRNTSIYLFDLEEYIQISFYATEDIPDKQYQRKKISGEAGF